MHAVWVAASGAEFGGGMNPILSEAPRWLGWLSDDERLPL